MAVVSGSAPPLTMHGQCCHTVYMPSNLSEGTFLPILSAPLGIFSLHFTHADLLDLAYSAQKSPFSKWVSDGPLMFTAGSLSAICCSLPSSFAALLAAAAFGRLVAGASWAAAAPRLPAAGALDGNGALAAASALAFGGGSLAVAAAFALPVALAGASLAAGAASLLALAGAFPRAGAASATSVAALALDFAAPRFGSAEAGATAALSAFTRSSSTALEPEAVAPNSCKRAFNCGMLHVS
mmetsp:Transcript_16410/g.48935  ORF Transcript_16410/g.48935 Transcript_16410/m.48935 type:complete len:240 (+) Transcript_16410:1419-2138(+)